MTDYNITFKDLSAEEQAQYTEILICFASMLKDKTNSSEFINKMNTYPSKITKFFAKTPIPGKIMENLGILPPKMSANISENFQVDEYQNSNNGDSTP